jgi:hypothetical protein
MYDRTDELSVVACIDSSASYYRRSYLQYISVSAAVFYSTTPNFMELGLNGIRVLTCRESNMSVARVILARIEALV